MNNTLVLLTDSFPYDTKETFLELEIKYLSKKFKEIYIIPLRESSVMRSTPENVFVLNLFSKYRVSKYKRVFLTLASTTFYDAIVQDFPGSFSLPYMKLNFIWSFNTKLMSVAIQELIEEKSMNLSSTIFYAYMFTSSANALSLLKSNDFPEMKIVTRVHGGDLYEDRLGFSTFPYRKLSLGKIDKIFSISKDGIQHLQKAYHSKNVVLSQLGVLSRGKSKLSVEKNHLHIVSCSHIIPLKRVYLIAKIIKKLNYRKITWTHFGQGKDEKLDRLLSGMENHIDVFFEGQRENQYVLEYYTKYAIDLFINVSTSEGIPVSIMEAMSASIPVLATDVGGTSEIVRDEWNGFLLNKDFKIEDAIEKINIIKNRQVQFKENAYQAWKNDFDADKNYSDFALDLKQLEKRTL